MPERKAKPKDRKPPAVFEIRIRSVYPEQVPVDAIADAINAIKQIVAQGEPTPESAHSAPPETSVGLIGIRRGSAVYSCTSSHAESALERLRALGRVISDIDARPDDISQFFWPLRILSSVVRRLGAKITLRAAGKASEPLLAEITSDTYASFKARYTLTGTTTILGNLQRIGGVTRHTCVLRVPGQPRLVYCVTNRAQARELASRLYENVSLEGTARWASGTWHILDFKVSRILPYRDRPFAETRKRLREAGADEWDKASQSDLFFT